jgi:hypothetical protein
MSILKTQLKSKLGLGGVKQKTIPGSLPGSTLHNTSSINGKPTTKRSPSKLDLDGKTPRKYTDKLPR